MDDYKDYMEPVFGVSPVLETAQAQPAELSSSKLELSEDSASFRGQTCSVFGFCLELISIGCPPLERCADEMTLRYGNAVSVKKEGIRLRVREYSVNGSS